MSNNRWKNRILKKTPRCGDRGGGAKAIWTRLIWNQNISKRDFLKHKVHWHVGDLSLWTITLTNSSPLTISTVADDHTSISCRVSLAWMIMIIIAIIIQGQSLEQVVQWQEIIWRRLQPTIWDTSPQPLFKWSTNTLQIHSFLHVIHKYTSSWETQ